MTSSCVEVYGLRNVTLLPRLPRAPFSPAGPGGPIGPASPFSPRKLISFI